MANELAEASWGAPSETSADSASETHLPCCATTRGTSTGRPTARGQVAAIGLLAFCGPGLFNALNGLGNAGSASSEVAAVANGCLYLTFAASGYLSAAAFNLLGPIPLLTLGGCTYAVYAVCVFFSAAIPGLAALGGVVLGIGAGLFWTAQSALMMLYATPDSRGSLIALFWIIFNLGGVAGGLLQFGFNFHNTGTGANPVSYFAFVCVMLSGALSAPCVLARPADVIRDDGSKVAVEPPESPWRELRAAAGAIGDPFVRRNFLFFLASNWFYTYNFSGFNASQFNMRTRGLNSALFWAAQMLAAWLFGKLLDSRLPLAARASQGMGLAMLVLITSLGLALWINIRGPCNGGHGFDKNLPCELDYQRDWPGVLAPMLINVVLGAADAMYQNFALWLMSTAAGGDARRTVMYASAYKGVQSLGAGTAWLLDLSGGLSYRMQGAITLVLTTSACLPVLPVLRDLDVSSGKPCTP